MEKFTTKYNVAYSNGSETFLQGVLGRRMKSKSFEMFMHKNDGFYVVTEMYTGLRIGAGSSEIEAKRNAISNLKRTDDYQTLSKKFCEINNIQLQVNPVHL